MTYEEQVALINAQADKTKAEIDTRITAANTAAFSEDEKIKTEILKKKLLTGLVIVGSISAIIYLLRK